MVRKDNYLIQANQAKQHFLTYDQQRLIEKLNLQADENYLYIKFLCESYRLSRTTGSLERHHADVWEDANSFAEVMTILDLVCDSRENRYLSGRWKSMTDFGLMFHTNLLEDRRDKTAMLFDGDPEGLHRACRSMSGRPIKGADIGYAIEVFDGLEIGIQFWHGDDEFYPRLRYLWDENATMYIRYETMHYFRPLFLQRLKERM